MTTRSTWLCSTLFLLSMTTGCDEPADAQTAEDDFGGGDVTDRCTVCSGLKLNTGWLGDEPLSVIDNTGGPTTAAPVTRSPRPAWPSS